jgi:hypothetical protein
MRFFQITLREIVALMMALALSVVAVYLRSTYFPSNQVDWAIDPPFYFERLVYSNFHWPQENSLALVLLCYLPLGLAARAMSHSAGAIKGC